MPDSLYNVSMSPELTISSNITAGAFGITKTGGGMLALSGNNTYGATTTINNGWIKISGVQPLPTTQTVTFGNAIGVGLEVAQNESIGSLTGGGVIGGTILLDNGVNLSIGADGNAAQTFAGQIQGGTANQTVLTKVGTVRRPSPAAAPTATWAIRW